MKKIEKKINELGGIKTTQSNEETQEAGINSFEKENNILLPVFFRNFMIRYAPFSFNKLVKKEMDKIPNSFIDGNLSVDYFYSFNNRSQNSISKLLEDYKEQITSSCIPFCDGEAGDFFCISLIKNDFGAIYYFHHEAENDRLTRISNSFEDFFNELIVETDQPIDNVNWKMPEDVKENSTDEFLKSLEEWKAKNQ